LRDEKIVIELGTFDPKGAFEMAQKRLDPDGLDPDYPYVTIELVRTEYLYTHRGKYEGTSSWRFTFRAEWMDV